jgi:hypothetical protein
MDLLNASRLDVPLLGKVSGVCRDMERIVNVEVRQRLVEKDVRAGSTLTPIVMKWVERLVLR